MCFNLADVASLSYYVRFLACRRILRHGASGFTSHPKKGVLRIFIALKNLSSRSDLKPRPLGPVASTLTTEATEKLLVALLWRNFPPFMEPLGSLTRSQRQTTGSCPHSDKCTPHILLHTMNFNSLISFHLYILLLSGFHLSGFPTQTLYARKEDTIPKNCHLLDAIAEISHSHSRLWYL
jgi:hypothetical protein